jgi:hypothetical protein
LESNDFQELEQYHDVRVRQKKQKGGRPKNTGKKADKKRKAKKMEGLNIATKQCMEANAKAKLTNDKVKDGTYQGIINKVEMLDNVEPGTIRLETVRSRMLANNPLGTNWQRTSPLYKVEPMLDEMLCELARIGEAQTKYEIMELADEMVKSTEHATAYIEFCEKRQITKNWDEGIVGERWYQNFMRRNEDPLKRARFKVQDANQRTYCTYDNVANMYNSVYESMVEAGVAIKLDEEAMFDNEGNITGDPSKMSG